MSAIKVDQADWIQESAMDSLESTEHTPVLMVGSVVAGCMATALSGMWPIGLGVGALGIWLARKQHDKILDATDYAIQYGAAPAAIKDGKKLREYSDHMGKKQAAEQLLQAARSGLPLSAAQMDLLEEVYEDELDELMDKPLGDGEVKRFHEIQPIAHNFSGQSSTQPLAQGANSEEATTKYSGIELGKQKCEVVDVADLMGRVLKPTIIGALPRVGKGVLIANAWRAAKKYHPDLKVYVIDPKSHPDEAGYWEGCDRVLRIRFDLIPVNCPKTIAALEAFIDEWRNDPAPQKLLIFDEQILTKAKLPKWYKDYVVPMIEAEGSAGETFKRCMWVVMQSPLVGDIGLSGGSRAVYVFCALAAIIEQKGMNSRAWLESANASKFIPSIPVDSQFETSPRGTLCYTSLLSKWVAMPEYPVPTPLSAQKERQPVTQERKPVTQERKPANPTALRNLDAAKKPEEVPVSKPIAANPEPEKAKGNEPKNETWESRYFSSLVPRLKEIEQRFIAGKELGYLAEEFAIAKGQIVNDLYPEGREDLICIAMSSMIHGEVTAHMVRNDWHREDWYKALCLDKGTAPVAVRSLFEELANRGMGDCYDGSRPDRRTYKLLNGDDRTLTNQKSGKE